MKKMKKILCIIAIISIIACCVFSSGAFDGNDYDGGGWDGGGGGGDWDFGGDDDWGDGGGGVFFFGDYGGFGGFGGGVLVVVIIIIAIAVSKSKQKGGGGIRHSSNQGLHIQLPDRTGQIEGIVKSHDPNFSASDFLSFSKRVYIDIQTAWCKRDLKPVRAFLHDNLYDATVKQVQSKIDQGVVYHYESMVVNTAYLTSYAKDEQFEYVTIYLNARMIDWQEDEKTGKILRGDKTTRWDMRYKMKFMRSIDVLTKEGTSGATEHNCPNCGAPLEMTSSASCKYCSSVVTTGKYSWVLSDFGTVRNDTRDEGIVN